MERRKCKTCGMVKPLKENFRSHFVKNKWYYEHECRRCTVDKLNAKRLADPEAARAKERASYAANRDVARAQGRRKYQRNKKEIAEKRAQQRKVNGDRVRALDRVVAMRWRQRHPFEAQIGANVRRARKLKAKIAPITKEQIENLHRRQRGRCAACKHTIAHRHIDHVIPLSKGGAHEIGNLQLLCRGCNTSKRADHPIDFMQKMGFLL